jgi:uncharacterized membrane protein YedE/YeeE
MKALKFIFVGIIFGIVMSKSEAISWYRIQEMFRFQSFHMYGIIGTAVTLGIIIVQLIKRFGIKDYAGNPIVIAPKEKGYIRAIVGGTIFGLGWALTGACPGPLFVNLGYGFLTVSVVIIGAVGGAWLYGYFQDQLPH